MTGTSSVFARPRAMRGASPPGLGRVIVRRHAATEEHVALMPGERAVLGASAACALRVRDAEVGEAHCEIRHVGDGVEVRDLGTATGTFLFGARVPSAVLQPPALFSLGPGGPLVEVVTAPEPSSSPVEPLPGLAGESPRMCELAADVRRFAGVRLPVLVRGESGVGKEVVARSLHDLGPRRAGPFVAINAASVSRELAESELFGHVRGAFTGATCDRRGAFREAHGGTLFVDEVASLGVEAQAKLLRVVEDGVIRPLGGDARVTVDVRLVAATCEPLERMVDEGRFREDLYERIAVCVVRVPALRDRVSDIPAIATALLASTGIDAQVSPEAMTILSRQRYRGNVRELRNVLVQCALLSADRTISAHDVVAVLAMRAGSARPPRLASGDAVRWLDACEGNVTRAARAAGVPRSTLRDHLRSDLRGQRPLGRDAARR